MGHLTDTRTANSLAKPLGSDSGCEGNFAVSEVAVFLRKSRRARSVGLHGGPGKRHSTVDRFWARVQKIPDGCWLFAGAVSNRAGHVHISRDDGSRVYAHRYSFELHHGRIRKGLVVMHSCDVARCVNPAHLSVGTQRDNIHDAIDKGRFAPWRHPNTVAARSRPRLAHESTVARPQPGCSPNPLGGRT